MRKDVLQVYFLEILAIKSFTSDNQPPYFSFLQTFFENIFFNCVHTDKSVNVHSLSLTDPVRSVLSLFVHRWIPIGVVENYTISTSQVDTDSSTSCA